MNINTSGQLNMNNNNLQSNNNTTTNNQQQQPKLNFYQQAENTDNGTLNDFEGTDGEEIIFP